MVVILTAAVSLLAVMLTVLLFWGMRSDPRAVRLSQIEEIAADDPPREKQARSVTFDDVELTLRRDRRRLVSLWGPDTPDLLFSLWRTTGGSGFATSCLMPFLDFGNGMEPAMGELEARLFEGAEAMGVPSGSIFLTAYSFVALPENGWDMMIRSTFMKDGFLHEKMIIDQDDRMQPLGGGIEPSNAAWLDRRSALTAVAQADPDTATDYFSALSARRVDDGRAHAWMGHLTLGDDDGSTESHRRLRLAQEFGAPDCALAGLLRARMSPGGAMDAWADRLLASLANDDRDSRAPMLAVQSLVTLNQREAARALCARILRDDPASRTAERLLALIDQTDRRAQT